MPSFELKEDKFIEKIPFYDDRTFKPTKEQWTEFWEKMDEIDIWNWKEYYRPTDCLILDGIGWRIKIVLGDRRLESVGSNAYPDLNPKHATTNLSQAFEKFVKAFKDLTGIDILEENERRWTTGR